MYAQYAAVLTKEETAMSADIIKLPSLRCRRISAGRNIAALERAKAVLNEAAAHGWLSLDDIWDVAEIAERAAKPNYVFRFTIGE
jgi:hypothetical protein